MLDASIFYNGTGSDQPFGVRTGLTISQRVQTAGAGAFAYADVYSLKQAIRPRDIANATWAFHPNRIDTIWQFVAGGDTTDAPIMNEARDRILGKPAVEWTSVPTATTTGTTIGLYGDFRAAYTIVDRIGMTAEIVPHLFGGGGPPERRAGLLQLLENRREDGGPGGPAIPRGALNGGAQERAACRGDNICRGARGARGPRAQRRRPAGLKPARQGP